MSTARDAFVKNLHNEYVEDLEQLDKSSSIEMRILIEGLLNELKILKIYIYDLQTDSKALSSIREIIGLNSRYDEE